jgi:hypothetical protein
MLFKDIIDAYAPGFESYDGRGKNVDRQGERQMNHYADGDYVLERDTMDPVVFLDHEQLGHQRNRK